MMNAGIWISLPVSYFGMTTLLDSRAATDARENRKLQQIVSAIPAEPPKETR
jgi:hypothetical protein